MAVVEAGQSPVAVRPTRRNGLAQLRGDLERFIFLLGGSDGGPLFGPPRLT